MKIRGKIRRKIHKKSMKKTMKKCMEKYMKKCMENVRRKRRFYQDYYPNATSSAIIRLKPTANEITPIFECFPADISGISSSTTT